MRCTSCNHELWNQPAPADGTGRCCAECGTAYVVADFDFMPGKVEFCCPHCMQAYFGTSARGHIEPSEFDCQACGKPVAMDRCILRPHATHDERTAMVVAPLPWLLQLGFLARFWGTAKVGFGKGAQLPKMLGGAAPIMQASIFLAILLWLSGLTNLLIGMATVLGLQYAALGVPGSSSIGLMVVYQLSLYLLNPLWMMATVAAASWLIARAMSSYGLTMSRAYCIICFSSGALLLGFIPWCGSFIGMILWAVQGSVAIATAVPRAQGAAAVWLGLSAMLAGLGVQSIIQMVLGTIVN